MPIASGERYHLPVLVEYIDENGARTSDVFCGWWYGQGMIRNPASVEVDDSDALEVRLIGLKWQTPWLPWTRRRSKRFMVSDLKIGA